MKYITSHTAIGTIHIGERDGKICYLDMEKPEGEKQATPLLEKAEKQIQQYLDGKRKEFTLPLEPQGTPFQKRVWEELQKIPYGQTKTYQEIAISIGNPKAQRAIGMANNKNPIMIIIPCHRIIGKNKKLTGYKNSITTKQHLLTLEGALGSGFKKFLKREI